MTNDSQQFVNKAWNFAHVLRDDGLSYMAYTEQITFLLFLKMADEQSKPPSNKKPGVPDNMSWQTLFKLDGEALELHHRKFLEEEHEDEIRRSFRSRSVSSSNSFVPLTVYFFAWREELFATE